MKTYEKPIISVDEGLAEGVYAASGSGNNSAANEIIITYNKIDSNWGGSGQISLSADYSGLTNRSGLSVTLQFNMPVKNVYGDGISGHSNLPASTITLSYWGVPASTGTIIVQADGDINALTFDGYSYKNV